MIEKLISINEKYFQICKKNQLKMARFSSLAINFLNSLVLIKLYGVQLFGVFAFYISILKMLSVIGSFGSGLTSTRAFGTVLSIDRLSLRRKQSVFAFIVMSVSVAVSLVSVFLLYKLSYLTVYDGLWFFITAIFLSWSEFATNIFRAKKRYILFYMTGSSLHVSMFIVALFLLVNMRENVSDSQIIFSLFLSSIVVIIINLYYLFVKIKYVIIPVSFHMICDILNENMSAFFSSVLSSVTGNFEVILARVLFGDEESAIARMSFQLFYLMTTPIGLVNMEYHNLVNSVSEKKRMKIYAMMQVKSLKYILYGLIPFLVYLVALTDELSIEYQYILFLVILSVYFFEILIGPSNLFTHLSNKTSIIFRYTLVSLMIRFVALCAAYAFGFFEVVVIIVSVSSSNLIIKVLTRKKLML